MTRFWSPVADPTGRTPGVTSLKSAPHSRRRVATSLGAYPTFNFHVAGYGGRLVTAPYVDDMEDPDSLIDLAIIQAGTVTSSQILDGYVFTFHINFGVMTGHGFISNNQIAGV